MSDYKKLTVWAKAHQLVLEIYNTTSSFPKDEIYGLTSQVRRAAVSIPANIAEGSGRGGDKEFAQFLRISKGSATELEYHLRLEHDLGLLEKSLYQQLDRNVIEVQRMISGLIEHLKA
jgi:four helix bundle protein